MDTPMGDAPNLASDLSYAWQGYDGAEQVYNFSNVHSMLDSNWPTQSMDRQTTIEQSQVSHFFGPSPAVPLHLSQNVEALGDVQATPAFPMGPSRKREAASTLSMGPPRKRKAPTLRANVWEPYKERILELHIAQGLPLQEVKDMITHEFGFTAELRQYRTRISQWKKDKNIKPQEMAAIVRKRQQRSLLEPQKGPLAFTVRDKTVEEDKIDRWMKRNKVDESAVYAPSPAASTPSAVGCRTNSECGSPFPSPAYSVTSPVFSPGGITPMAQSPYLASPALSISSIVQPQGSTFVGQSPALTYRTLPSLAIGPLPAPGGFQSESNIVTGFTKHAYKQSEEEQLRAKLSYEESLYGKDHPRTLDTLLDLGYVVMVQGRYKSAEEVIRRVVESRRAVGGDDDADTMEALEALGHVFSKQGLYAKAERLHQRVLRFRKANQGLEHPDTLVAMSNLAATYRDQKRLDEAEKLGMQVLQIRKRELGAEHPDTLRSMGHLVIIYLGQQRLREAEELGVQILEIQKRVLGAEHLDTLITQTVLARVYYEQRRWDKAEELEVQVLKTRERVLGAEHPDTLMTQSNLAVTFKGQGGLEKAISLMEKCCQVRERVLGPQHPSTKLSRKALSRWQQEVSHGSTQ